LKWSKIQFGFQEIHIVQEKGNRSTQPGNEFTSIWILKYFTSQFCYTIYFCAIVSGTNIKTAWPYGFLNSNISVIIILTSWLYGLSKRDLSPRNPIWWQPMLWRHYLYFQYFMISIQQWRRLNSKSRVKYFLYKFYTLHFKFWMLKLKKLS
jgi:hypothetical protein